MLREHPTGAFYLKFARKSVDGPNLTKISLKVADKVLDLITEFRPLILIRAA